MHLDLSSCTIRDWSSTDAAGLLRHADDREVWCNLRDGFPSPYTRADAAAWLEFATGDGLGLQFAVVVGGEAAGGIGLTPGGGIHRRTAEIGFWLGRRLWGRGIMTEAVRAVTDHAFAQLEQDRVFAMVFDYNPASMRVLEKAGYRREGRLRNSAVKDGRTVDQILYAAVRS